MPRRSARTLFATLAVVALLAAACSSGRGDDASQSGSPDATDQGSSGEGPVTFGDLESPCGEGDATGATAQGVTDDAIAIGYGDDAGYQSSPGLSHQVSDAMEAMIDWCNEQGGINGREVVGTYYDAKVTEVANVMTEACGKEFFLVGEYWVLDDAQEPIRRECGLPAVPASTGTAAFGLAPDKYQAVPGPVDRAFVYSAAQVAEENPEAVTRAGVLWGDIGVIHDRRDQAIEAYSTVGWEFDPDCSVPYSILGEADWKPLVQVLKDCGAETVYWVGTPAPNFQNVLDAASQLEFEPIWFADANAYDESFAAWNQFGFADQVYFNMTQLPFEESEYSEAQQQYVALVEDNGGDVNSQGVQAASSFLLWATAAQACGSELTRECVMEELSAIHEWTGGGLHAPTDPGANEPSECSVMFKLEGTGFARVSPEEPGTFDCDPANVYDLDPSSEVLTRNNIDANRIAQL